MATEGEEKVGPGAKGKGPKDKVYKNKWWIVGILGGIAVLVFFFVNKSNSSANSGGTNAATGTPGSGMSPSDLSGLMGALQTIPQGPMGPAGPAGPAGAKGATGKTGKTGKTGPRGKPGKVPVKGKPHRHPKPRHSPPRGTTITARPGQTLQSIAAQYDHNVSDLYALNQHTIGAAGVVHPGMRIVL